MVTAGRDSRQMAESDVKNNATSLNVKGELD